MGLTRGHRVSEPSSVIPQEKIEEIVAEQVKSGMDWEFYIVVGIIMAPVLILMMAGLYEAMPLLAKLGMWVVLYITYFKSQEWAIARKVRHTIRDLRKVTER